MRPDDPDTNEKANSIIAPTTVASSRVVGLDGRILRDEQREIAVEVPVQILFGNVPFAVMMLTPSDLDDFAYGFSLTEGVVESADDIREVTIGRVDKGVTLSIRLGSDKMHEHLARQRVLTGRTGCGVCGIDDLAALRRASALSNIAKPLAVDSIARALAELENWQHLNTATRAVHGAAWANLSGNILAVREDVGRHNALDKLIGALLKQKTDPANGFVVIASRCSFEMVEKAAAFGARTLVAISAPTSLAVERAQRLGLMLIAIARRDTFTVFTSAERLLGRGAA